MPREVQVRHGQVPDPKHKITALLKGDRSLQSKMQISAEEFAKFRALMHTSMMAHFDLRKSLCRQDDTAVAKHYAQIRRRWNKADQYENAWPIIPKKLQGTGEDEGDVDDRSRPECDPTGRDNQRARSPDARQGERSRLDHSPESSPAPRPNTRGRDAARRQAQVHPPQQPDAFAPVLQFLRSLTPPLEGLASPFKAAGIKNVERLRALASWDDGAKWLADQVQLDPFEEETIRIALDEIQCGAMPV